MNLIRIIGLILFAPLVIFEASSILETPLKSGIVIAIYLIIIYFCLQPLSKNSREKKEAKLEVEKHLKEQLAIQLEAIKRGEKPTIKVQSAMLREGEIAHFSTEGILLEEKITGYEANSTSVRVKITKGVSVGKGGTKGKAIREIVGVSKGELAITNARIIFAGQLKSFEIPFSKLTNFHSIEDGLIFHVGSKSHIVRIPRLAIPIAQCLLENTQIA